MDTLNQLISVRLRPEWLVNNRLRIYREQLREEKIKLTRQLLDIFRSPAGRREKEAIVQTMQLNIIQWLDRLHVYRKALPEMADRERALFYLEAEGLLHDVLVALEQHVQAYLSPHLPLPFSYATRVKRQLQVRLHELELLFRALELDERLGELVLRPVRAFLLSLDGRQCFGSLFYFRDLMTQLQITGILQLAHPAEFQLQVHAILIHFNFNAVEYYIYCISRLEALLTGHSFPRDKIKLLTWYIITLRRLPLKKTPGLLPSMPPIVEQLKEWMLEERIFLRNADPKNVPYETSPI